MSLPNLAWLKPFLPLLPFLLALALLPTILFLRMLEQTLTRCAPESRTLPPRRVWLILVPLWNVVWLFVVVNALSNSLHREFTRRGIVAEPRPAHRLGTVYAILMAMAIIPVLGIPAFLAGALVGLRYGIRIKAYSGMLATPFVAEAA